jgi:hypothetical protein
MRVRFFADPLCDVALNYFAAWAIRKVGTE